MKENKNISIAVSIPLFNRIKLFKRTVSSVLNQSVPPDEFIIVDNGSTDGSYEYALTLKKRGVKVSRNKNNIGMIRNWNKSIEKAKSDYVVCLGSDDILLPDYIKVWREKLNSLGKDVGAAFSGGYIIDGKDFVKGILRPFEEDVYLKPPETIRYFWDNYRFLLSVTGWTLYNRKIIEKVGFFPTKYNIAAESGISMKILPKYPVFYSSTPFFAFRRHELQGFDKEVTKFSISQEVQNMSDVIKVLKEFEKNTGISKSFSDDERKNRIFIRKPISALLAQSLALFVLFNLQRARELYKLFIKSYPRPLFSFLTLRLLVGWSIRLLEQFIRNVYVKVTMGRKPILNYF